MTRWFGFLLAMAVGAAGGLFYGWVIDPVKYIDTTPDALRIDYRSDYVLMTAEVFQVEENLPDAIRRLALLDDASPVQIVSQALEFAEQHGYSPEDLAAMRFLYQALQSWNPVLGTLTP